MTQTKASAPRSQRSRRTKPDAAWTAATLFAGLDENGMGPLLGPLVVTCVPAEAQSERGARAAQRGATVSQRSRAGDSKTLVNFHDSRLGEAWARVLLETEAAPLHSPEDVLRRLSLHPAAHLEAPCPDGHRMQCWGHAHEQFEADADLLDAVRKDAAALARRGLRLGAPRSVILCNRRLNEAADRGISRFTCDLHAMEELVLDVNARFSREVFATCGKVGGFDRYGDVFGPLGGRLHVVVGESRARSEYHVPGVGRLAFVRDADGSNLLVGLASLVGKYLRDLLMRRITWFYRAQAPELPEASGYHDPVTKAFVAQTQAQRRKLRIADDCFARRKAL